MGCNGTGLRAHGVWPPGQPPVTSSRRPLRSRSRGAVRRGGWPPKRPLPRPIASMRRLCPVPRRPDYSAPPVRSPQRCRSERAGRLGTGDARVVETRQLIAQHVHRPQVGDQMMHDDTKGVVLGAVTDQDEACERVLIEIERPIGVYQGTCGICLQTAGIGKFALLDEMLSSDMMKTGVAPSGTIRARSISCRRVIVPTAISSDGGSKCTPDVECQRGVVRRGPWVEKAVRVDLELRARQRDGQDMVRPRASRCAHNPRDARKADIASWQPLMNSFISLPTAMSSKPSSA